MLNHVLLGWHRVIPPSEETLVAKWVQAREDALKDVLCARVMGGKDIFNLMKRRGWLSLGSQIMPVKKKTAVQAKSLVTRYDPVVLRTQTYTDFDPSTNRTARGSWVAVGLADERLTVRESLFLTPAGSYWIGTQKLYYLSFNEHHQKEKDQWLAFMKKLFDAFKKAEQSSSYLGSDNNPERLDLRSSPQTILFGEDGRKLPQTNLKEEGNVARLITKIGPSHITHSTHPANMTLLTLHISWDVLQIQLLPDPRKAPIEPMFLNYKDDE